MPGSVFSPIYIYMHVHLYTIMHYIGNDPFQYYSTVPNYVCAMFIYCETTFYACVQWISNIYTIYSQLV